MNTSKRSGAGFFILGVSLITIGLAITNQAVWIIGLVLVGFALLSDRKFKNQ